MCMVSLYRQSVNLKFKAHNSTQSFLIHDQILTMSSLLSSTPLATLIIYKVIDRVSHGFRSIAPSSYKDFDDLNTFLIEEEVLTRHKFKCGFKLTKKGKIQCGKRGHLTRDCTSQVKDLSYSINKGKETSKKGKQKDNNNDSKSPH